MITLVEYSPVFQDDKSLKAWFDFIDTEVASSAFTHPDSISGRVIVSFVIDSTGQIIDPKILQGFKSNFDQEAIKIISSSPKWKPGIDHGKAVNVTMVSPVDFNEERDKTKPPNKEGKRRNKRKNNYC